jgi:hypothetical protein
MYGVDAFFLHQALALICTETLAFCPDHPVLQIGVTVHIGLDKTCKLMNVFNRYVEVCNEQCPHHKISVADLEFVHTHVLSGNDTAEAAALMKNDEIKVRRDRTMAHQEEVAFQRLQRESDKDYFLHMRRLLPFAERIGDADPDPEIEHYADTILDCRGVLQTNAAVNASSTNQSKTIKCHFVLLYKRCPWLGRLITKAKTEQLYTRSSVVTVPEENKQRKQDMDEDDTFELMQKIKAAPPERGEEVKAGAAAAAQIENDDDLEAMDCANEASASKKCNQAVIGEESIEKQKKREVSSGESHLTHVVIDHHSPEAMTLLLEYCYSNRVVPLGYEAFVQACLTKPQYKKLQGPVAPFSLRPIRWPESGEPCISLNVALAGVRLAEEAEMPRLSLMCEVAAAQLVDFHTAVQALEACSAQRKLTGNDLPILRKATMEVVFRAQHISSTGVSDLLKSALKDSGSLLVPTLFSGTMEAVEAYYAKKKHSGDLECPFLVPAGEKRDWKSMAYVQFDKFDRIDAFERERERRKRRGGISSGFDETDEYRESNKKSVTFGEDDSFDLWCGGDSLDAFRGNLKRMSRHWNAGNRIGMADVPRRNSGGMHTKSKGKSALEYL